MSSFLRERVYVFSPDFITDTVKGKLEEEKPIWCTDKHVIHEFFSWSIKKAFTDVTGYSVEGFKENRVCEDFYNNFRLDFEFFMYQVYREMGNHLFKESLHFNLVLTYDRLYIITY